MSALGALARKQLRDAGITPAAYIEWAMGESTWYGDGCGCIDDRCLEHHHSRDESCRCLPALIQQFHEDAHKSQNMA